MFDCKGKPRSYWESEIDQWIYKERDRNILKRRLLDGRLYREIADEFEITERQAKRIVYKTQEILFKRIK